LRPNGFLLLGKAESINEASDLFSLRDKKSKFDSKKSISATARFEIESCKTAVQIQGSTAVAHSMPSDFDLQKEINRLLLSEHTPPGLVVNSNLEIVHFHGHTGPFLDPLPGAATLRLLKLAREGLPLELKLAIQKAQKDQKSIVRQGIPLVSGDGRREIDIEVRPISFGNGTDSYFVVLFREIPPSQFRNNSESAADGGSTGAQKLRNELDQTQAQLREMLEENETSTQELQAANEEIRSANEELQTAKEELQANNEELTTLNEELRSRNLDLMLANSDLSNVISNVGIPMVILDRGLRIRRFTPSAERVLNLIPADVGRPLTDLRSSVDFARIESLISDAITTMTTKEEDVTDRRGVWYSLRVRPYRSLSNTIEGAVLTMVNIDVLKEQATASRVYAEAIAETVRESILILDPTLRVITVNSSFLRTFKVSREEIEKRPLEELGKGQWNIPSLLHLLREILPKNSELRNFEVSHDFPNIGPRVMLLNARRIHRDRDSRQIILLAFEDVTEQKQAIENIRKQSELLQLAHDGIIVRDLNNSILFWNRGAQEMYGWTAGEACGNVTHQFLKTVFPESFDQIQDKLFKSGSWEGELMHSTRDGKKLTVMSRQVLQKDQQGQAIGILEINRDITLHKAAEESLRNLSARLLQLQDEERRRIARELHDSTGQSLAALVLHLSAVSATISATDPSSVELLQDAIGLAQKASDETRTLSYLLYPPTLDHAGLRSALEWYIDGFTQRGKVKVELDVSLGPDRLPDIVERTLFRVVQESLTNIFRHSGSESASVRIAVNSETVGLQVTDKGKGIAPSVLDALNRTGGQLGVGIRGMRERVRQLGGWLQIKSGDEGTTVLVGLPVRELGEDEGTKATGSA
jgi:PAS domain S-box-containing protein